MTRLTKILLAVAIVPMVLQAGAIRSGFNSTTFARNDDGSIAVNTGLNFNFYGISGPSVFLNNNGNVTFDQGYYTYTPFGITGISRPMIAPFFADVDTRGTLGDPVKYGSGTVDGNSAYGFSWINVDHYYYGSGPLNSFQLVLIDRSDINAGDFDFEFNYDQILWEAGTASGSNSAGLGGISASVGWTNGAGTYYQHPGSLVNGALIDGGPNALVSHSRNFNVQGRYVFQVRSGVVQPVPEPGTIALLGLGMLALLGVSRRRR